MDAVTEQLTYPSREAPCHFRRIGQQGVLVLFQPTQTVAENEPGTRRPAAIRAGAMGHGPQEEDCRPARRLGHAPILEVDLTVEGIELTARPDAGCAVLRGEVAQGPHHIDQVLDPALR